MDNFGITATCFISFLTGCWRRYLERRENKEVWGKCITRRFIILLFAKSRSMKKKGMYAPWNEDKCVEIEIWKTERGRPFEKSKRKWQHNFKIHVNDVLNAECIQLAQQSPVAGYHKYSTGSSCYTNAGNFLCYWSPPSFLFHWVILDCYAVGYIFSYLAMSFWILSVLHTWLNYRL